ncbi:phage antirepressor KilAC domain-containing protein [Streptomyces sp. MP131-18]|uniref:phage antirepressor KilAC domain-containing protein n=1 Tax=Streptomyces sp. MP131-18 TaxID=1857892 RepID=UPI001C0B39CE|nr:phage antirepressor KilAC domain-containing protein [Streptomyces sp. MP131-18]
MPFLGYAQWRRFTEAIEQARAVIIAEQGNEAADLALCRYRQEGTGGAPREDYQLSRYAAYLTAMRGDSRKPEIREALVYFAVRTREAETAPALPDLSTPTGVLALAEHYVATARQLVEADTKIRALEPKALAHDTLMAAQDGDVLVRQAAKLLGWAEKQLRVFLIDEGLVYRRQATCGAAQYDFYAAHADCFNAVERVVEHTWGSCAHYTLHLTPRGIAFVQMRIEKRRAEMAAAIEQAG